MDFVSDSLADGRSFRALAIVDQYTRECPVIEVDLSLPGARVLRVLEQLAGERDFCANARVNGFHDHGNATDLIGDTAVITFQYEMTYERSGERHQATGRDLWVFREIAGAWIAVWRAMLDLHEQPT